MYDMRCTQHNCNRKVDCLDYAAQARLCERHFNEKMAWATDNRGTDTNAMMFYERYYHHPDEQEPEPSIIDENGRERTIKKYLAELYGNAPASVCWTDRQRNGRWTINAEKR